MRTAAGLGFHSETGTPKQRSAQAQACRAFRAISRLLKPTGPLALGPTYRRPNRVAPSRVNWEASSSSCCWQYRLKRCTHCKYKKIEPDEIWPIRHSRTTSLSRLSKQTTSWFTSLRTYLQTNCLRELSRARYYLDTCLSCSIAACPDNAGLTDNAPWTKPLRGIRCCHQSDRIPSLTIGQLLTRLFT